MMKCPKCRFENREGAQFCNECGSKMELLCPQCENANRTGSKFCDKCGCKLITHSETPLPPPQDLSFDEKLEKIQKYLPNGLTDKILAQRGK
ncbi:MAG: zinc ribbon domain-containing protein, partial [Thermodesulfobacteriota bacterium]|nr:zinc ribbon domain-containing protein [Thermodesulfobacteriota bacterium]